MMEFDFLARFQKLESLVAAEKGDFVFFALFLREGAPNRWDLLISAPWAYADQKAALDYFVNKIKSDLGPGNLTQLSRIVFVNPEEASLQALIQAIHVEHGSTEVRDRIIFGLPIKQGFIITSKEPATAAA